MRKTKPLSNAKILELADKPYKTPDERQHLCRMVDSLFQQLREGRKQHELRSGNNQPVTQKTKQGTRA